ncbi:MAG: DUF3592 domain-containing protein [Candidatus Krumholzibacteria bacterium]|nr:DUF3592 domain-containing protein [Candidatus Krumholzibacteria bacterium]
MARRGLYFLVSVVFVAAGIAMTIRGKGVLGDAKASATWPAAYGKIVTSQVTKKSHQSRRNGRQRTTVTYWANLSYRYDVDGLRYTSDTVSFGEYGSDDPEHARDVVHRYPEGKEVEVHYNPTDPEVAVLEPGVSRSSYLALGLGLVFSITGAALLVGGIIRLR